MQEVRQSREEVRQSREEARQSREEVEQKLESAIVEVKREVNVAQEKTLQDVTRKIGNTTYQKGHEHQYKFNCGVEEAISSTRTELMKMKPSTPEDKEALKKVETSLEDGMKQLATRQKHIKIADRSDHGWATVSHYLEDPLASGPDDEKRLDRAESDAEKDAKKEADRGANKRPRGGGSQGGNSNKRRHLQYRDPWNEPPRPSNSY